jgi:Family of unknown function (DUF6496)
MLAQSVLVEAVIDAETIRSRGHRRLLPLAVRPGDRAGERLSSGCIAEHFPYQLAILSTPLASIKLIAKYGKAAGKRVKSAMHRKKKGTLKSGSGRKVKSRKQAIAIGLSEAREKGAKVLLRKSSHSRKKL